jgi:hypothetical protein
MKHDCDVDCRLGLDVFGEPLDDEDYLHEVTTLADPNLVVENTIIIVSTIVVTNTRTLC